MAIKHGPLLLVSVTARDGDGVVRIDALRRVTRPTARCEVVVGAGFYDGKSYRGAALNLSTTISVFPSGVS